LNSSFASVADRVKPIGMNSAPRLDSLTGLRFVAALGVAFAHLPYLHTPDRIGRILSEGGIGVPFFFILSGFVLTLAYRERLATPSRAEYKAYYVSRIARVWPLHLLTFALSIALPVGPQAIEFGPALANAFLVHTWFPDLRYVQSNNSVSWTLAIESFFYLALPFFLWVVAKWKTGTSRQLILAAVVVWGLQYAWVRWHKHGTDVWTQYLVAFCPPARVGEFAVGILLALAHQKTPAPIHRRRWQWTAIEIAAVAAILYQMACSDRTHPLLRLSVYYVPTLAFAVAVFARSRGALSQILAMRIPVFLGDVSFAFFLIHPFAFIYIGVRYAMPFGPTICAVVSLATALVAAIALNRWVERPLRSALPGLMEGIGKRIRTSHDRIGRSLRRRYFGVSATEV
jgi:peptidoglycan/LPS O-acetylase OafA/YrhL